MQGQGAGGSNRDSLKQNQRRITDSPLHQTALRRHDVGELQGVVQQSIPVSSQRPCSPGGRQRWTVRGPPARGQTRAARTASARPQSCTCSSTVEAGTGEHGSNGRGHAARRASGALTTCQATQRAFLCAQASGPLVIKQPSPPTTPGFPSHVRNHEQQALRAGERGCQGAGSQRAVQRARHASLRLHLCHLQRGAAFGKP